jgi:hypothetical protein
MNFTGVSFEISSINTDAISIAMDVIFWTFFVTAHCYVYLLLVKVCLEYAIFFYLFPVFAVTWAFSNRLLQNYIPSIIFAVALFSLVEMRTIYDSVLRYPGAWLSHIVLIFFDGILVLGHTYDEMLTIDVALNCRIAYASAVGILLEIATVAQDSFS